MRPRARAGVVAALLCASVAAALSSGGASCGCAAANRDAASGGSASPAAFFSSLPLPLPPAQRVNFSDAPMVCLPGGTFLYGNAFPGEGYPEEFPQRRARVAAFAMDATEVTRAHFSAFVAATGYVTGALNAQRQALD
jgi:formylglycine-generating enzyme required for sulfatase activity